LRTQRIYFAYAMRLGASARRVAHCRLLCLVQARCQLLHLRRASGCLSTLHGLSRHSSSTTSPTSRGLSRDSSSTTSPSAGSSSTTSTMSHVRVPRHVARLVTRLVVDYFDYAALLSALACRAAHHAARHAARRRLLCLCRTSECLGTSRGSSRRSSSTTSPPPRVRVPRHVARLVVDYSVSCDFVLQPHWLYFNHAVHCNYLSRSNTCSTSSTPRAATTSSSGRIASTIRLD
jgi:hypothetical protein